MWRGDCEGCRWRAGEDRVIGCGIICCDRRIYGPNICIPWNGALHVSRKERTPQPSARPCHIWRRYRTTGLCSRSGMAIMAFSTATPIVDMSALPGYGLMVPLIRSLPTMVLSCGRMVPTCVLMKCMTIQLRRNHKNIAKLLACAALWLNSRTGCQPVQEQNLKGTMK